MAQTFEAELVRCARNVARLQTRLRRLRREIKKTSADLRTERRHLRALAASNTDPDVAPSRVFGGGVGLKPARPSTDTHSNDVVMVGQMPISRELVPDLIDDGILTKIPK